MLKLKTFESFNSSDKYIKSALSKFGLKYEKEYYNGNLCIKAESSLNDNGDVFDFTFYIFASHPDKESATYHITFLIDGRIENSFSTTNLEKSIENCISEIR